MKFKSGKIYFLIAITYFIISCQSKKTEITKIASIPNSLKGEYISIGDYYNEDYENEEKRKTYINISDNELHFIIADSDYEGPLGIENPYGDEEGKLIDSIGINEDNEYIFYCKEMSNSEKISVYLTKSNQNFLITEWNFNYSLPSKTEHGLFKKK